MEVSNDPERSNAMTMEEDNFDIDLDLGDEPQNDHDEDSMMDDEPEGHAGDQDLQMDEDYHEQGDQDDEILDYVEDEPAILEVPMTEESTGPQQEQDDNTQSLFNTNTNVVPETPAFASFVSQAVAPNPFPDAGASQPPHAGQSASQESAQPHLATPADDSDKLESIRSLYEGEAGVHDGHIAGQPNDVDQASVPIAEQTGPEAAHPKDHDGPVQPTPGETDDKVGPDGVHDEALTPAVPEDDFDDSLTVTQNPQTDVHTEGPMSEHGSTAESTQEAADSRPGTAEHAHESATHADTEHEPDENATNIPEEPLPVLVTYRAHQMSLFPPLTKEDGTPETYLLPDSSVFDQTISSFLDTCHNALAADLEKTDELEVVFPSFDFKFRMHDPEAASFTLRHIAELCVQFQQHDGVDPPEPLYIRLVVLPSLSARINYLYDLAKEGKGLKYVEEMLSSRVDEDTGPDIDEHEQDDDTNYEGEEHAWDAENDALSGSNDVGEVGNVDPAQAEHGNDEGADRNDLNTSDATEGSHSKVTEPAGSSTAVATGVPGTGVTPPEGVAAFEEGGEIIRGSRRGSNNDAPSKDKESPNESKTVAVEGQQFGENAQTAEEIDFEDDEWAHEQTNTDNPDAADAQHGTFESTIETSQSLHSATELEATAVSPVQASDEAHEGAGDNESPEGHHPDPSDTSSTTVQGADGEHPSATAGDTRYDDEDIFADEETYEPGSSHEDHNNVDDNLDFGQDDGQTKSPSLKRIRSEVDEVGGEADPEEGDYIDWNEPSPNKKLKLTSPAHPLKRSRSDIAE